MILNKSEILNHGILFILFSILVSSAFSACSVPKKSSTTTPLVIQAQGSFAVGGAVIYAADAKTTDEQAEKMPFDLYREGHYYYHRTHAHPNSTFRYTMSSLLDLMEFDAASNMDLINQPLLMMAGSKSDTYYMTDSAFALATGTTEKEMFLIPNATHIQTYYVPEYVAQAMTKLNVFFSKISIIQQLTPFYEKYNFGILACFTVRQL